MTIAVRLAHLFGGHADRSCRGRRDCDPADWNTGRIFRLPRALTW